MLRNSLGTRARRALTSATRPLSRWMYSVSAGEATAVPLGLTVTTMRKLSRSSEASVRPAEVVSIPELKKGSTTPSTPLMAASSWWGFANAETIFSWCSVSLRFTPRTSRVTGTLSPANESRICCPAALSVPGIDMDPASRREKSPPPEPTSAVARRVADRIAQVMTTNQASLTTRRASQVSMGCIVTLQRWFSGVEKGLNRHPWRNGAKVVRGVSKADRRPGGVGLLLRLHRRGRIRSAHGPVRVGRHG